MASARRTGAAVSSKLLLIVLALSTCVIASLNFILNNKAQSDEEILLVRSKRGLQFQTTETQQLKDENKELRRQLDQARRKLETQSLSKPGSGTPNQNLPTYLVKASSINSFWWPYLDSGLLAKMSTLQNPTDCSSPNTKFYVWRSLPSKIEDTRGLSAWGHTAMWNLLHALTDGDQFQKSGPRILITDEELWPMAKGCEHGPETRECYFEPLTKCKLSDVDLINVTDVSKVHALNKYDEEYDRSVRTLYSPRDYWWRNVKDAYAWTGLSDKNSEIAMVAASLAYYFNPKPWLRAEIHERLQKSIPDDLDPDRTIGVPIRRSDKCRGHNITGSAGGEMDCHPIETYLKGVKRFLAFDPRIHNVIVTSEDKAACDEFIELVRKELPKLRVVINVGDVQQGTGSGSRLESYNEGATNSGVIASALTSMHMHMRARYFVMTSRSTWTSAVTLMSRVYGFATSDVFVIDLEAKHNRLASLAKTGCDK